MTALGVAGSTEEEKSTNAASTSTTTSVAPPTSEAPAPAAKPVVQVSTAPAANAALVKLNTLAVKGRAPKTGYDRAMFGETWTDNVNVEGGRNGCDTRNDILRRDLVNIVVKPGSKGCAVESGTLNDPYTGKTIQFVRGQDTSTAVQIDHVVALSNAWQPILIFVAAIAVPFITILGTWVKTKIDGRDQRATISAELEILAKLDQHSDAARKLAASIDKQIDALVDPPQGWSRATVRTVIVLGPLPFAVLVGVLFGVGVDWTVLALITSTGYAILVPVVMLCARRLRERRLWLMNRP